MSKKHYIKMKTLENLIKNNEATIGFLRWIILPILFAASLWILDARYLPRGDWHNSSTQQNNLITQLSSEQKQSFTKLTDAIANLAIEQRNAAEFNRVNSTSINSVITQLEKHQLSDAARWEKIATSIEKLDSRLDALEALTAKHEVLIKNSKESSFRGSNDSGN